MEFRTNGHGIIAINRWIYGIHVLWLAVFIGFFLGEQAHCGRLPRLDVHIDDLERVSLLSGREAIRAINRLHGMAIDMERGFVASYQAPPGEKATIWVSEAPSQELGEKQIEMMVAKMKGNQKSPFEKYRTVKAKGINVIGFDGLGQVHYVFGMGKWVYWISADEKRVDRILRYITKNH